MHIAMNMMSMIAIGTYLEFHFGTLWITFTILWSILLTSAVYVLVAFLIYILLGMDGLMYSHSVGFSGVLFHLLVIQAHVYPNESRQLFGMCSVPSTAYPWVLMVVLQVVMPNLSLLGHLSGIICGTCQVYGLLNSMCVPSVDYLRSCDDGLRTILTRRTSSSVAERYVNSSLASPPSIIPQQQLDTGTVRRLFSSSVGKMCKFLRGCGKKIRIIIFGHPDAQVNGNIRISTSGIANVFGVAFGNDEEYNVSDDKEWIGLPPGSKPSPPPESAYV